MVKLKELFTKDLTKTKAGKILILALAGGLVVIVLSNQFSAESRCRRKVESLFKLLPSEVSGKNMLTDTYKKLEIEKCVKESRLK